MILIDANLLLYAVNTDAPDHTQAKQWVTNALSGVRGTVASCDNDFAKFPGLRWINPLTP